MESLILPLETTCEIYLFEYLKSSTYDHRFKKLALPVRSAVLKLVTGALVVRWVTTGEYTLLYVFACGHLFLEVFLR
jgi:hypothetical protein